MLQTLQMIAQPDDATCGPTSLHAVYQYLGFQIDLFDVIRDVNYLEEGGTLASFLGIDALHRGLQARLYSYDLHIFDPTWSSLSSEALRERLGEQLKHKRGRKFRATTEAYCRFLEMGGELRFADLSGHLLRTYFDKGLPVLAGLSATYLYGHRREYVDQDGKVVHDDICGEPAGHFVVLYGLSERGSVLVADPYRGNPFDTHRYEVDLQRLLNAIMLGIITYDANLLIVSPGFAP